MQFQIKQIQTDAVSKKGKKIETTVGLRECRIFYCSNEGRCNEKEVLEEHCWATTQAWGHHATADQVLVRLDCLIYRRVLNLKVDR